MPEQEPRSLVAAHAVLAPDAMAEALQPHSVPTGSTHWSAVEPSAKVTVSQA